MHVCAWHWAAGMDCTADVAALTAGPRPTHPPSVHACRMPGGDFFRVNRQLDYRLEVSPLDGSWHPCNEVEVCAGVTWGAG